MKKLRNLFVVVLIVLALFLSFKPVVFARAESGEGEEEYILIGYNFNAGGVDVKEKYNIERDHISPFTPFNFETEQRLAGSNFSLENSPETRESKQATVNVEPVVISKSGDYSLFMWLYFDQYFVHDLKITLNFDGGVSLGWVMSGTDLLNLLTNGGVSVSQEPHAWNLIELPFSKSNNIGDEFLNKEAKSILIDYSTPDASRTQQFSGIRFYDIKIKPTNPLKDINIVEHQDYVIYDCVEFDKEIRDTMIIGDELETPNLSAVVKYAWIGDVDLKRLITNSSASDLYVWSMNFYEPGSSNPTRVFAADKLKFEKEGQYRLSYQCRSTSGDLIVSFSQVFEVIEFRPVHFNKPNFNLFTKTTYTFNAYVNDILKDAGDLSFKPSSDKLIINYLGDGVFEISALEPGEYSFEVSVVGRRAIDKSGREYTFSVDVNALEREEEDHSALKIFLYIVLGVAGTGLLVYVIILLVRRNKIVVK